MIPKKNAVAFLIQFGDSDAILVGRCFLGHNVHCYLGKIEVGSNTNCRSDSGRREYIVNHGHCHNTGWFNSEPSCLRSIGIQISAAVYKAFVDAVYVNILRSDVFQIDLIDLGGYSLVLRHPRNCYGVMDPGMMADFIHSNCLFSFKEPRPGWNSDSLESRRNRKTYGLIRTGFICDKQVCLQRIQIPVNTFDRSVIAFQINTDISRFHSSQWNRNL